MHGWDLLCVSEDGKFFTLIDGELNIDPNQKVFFGDGYFTKHKESSSIRYYTKGKNLRLYWKSYRENIERVLNKFVEIVIDAIRDERDMTDLIDIYKRDCVPKNASKFNERPTL